jgi:uncharacterized protein YlxW (UPF0749 family)
MTRACRRLLRQFIKLRWEFKATKRQSSVLFRAMRDAEKRKRDAERDRADAERGLGKSQSQRNRLKRQVEDARNRLL